MGEVRWCEGFWYYTSSLTDARRDQQGGKGEGTICFGMIDGSACVEAALFSWDKV